jgi:hypothetical protein
LITLYDGGGHVTEGMMVMFGVNGFMLRYVTIPIVSFDYLPQLSAEENVRLESYIYVAVTLCGKKKFAFLTDCASQSGMLGSLLFIASKIVHPSSGYNSGKQAMSCFVRLPISLLCSDVIPGYS